MTLATTVVGLSFVFENTNLSAFPLFQNLASNLRACNGWLTDLYAVAGYEKNFIKSYFCACFNVQFFNGNDFAFFNAVLFTTGFDNCVQCAPPLYYTRRIWQLTKAFTEPSPCGCVMAPCTMT